MWNKLATEHPKPVSIKVEDHSAFHPTLTIDSGCFENLLFTTMTKTLANWSSLSGVRETDVCTGIHWSWVGVRRQRACDSPEVVGDAQTREAYKLGGLSRSTNHSRAPWSSPHGWRAWGRGSQEQAGHATLTSSSQSWQLLHWDVMSRRATWINQWRCYQMLPKRPRSHNLEQGLLGLDLDTSWKLEGVKRSGRGREMLGRHVRGHGILPL